MYRCEEIKSINIRYMDDTDRELTPDEVSDVCKKANENNDSIERFLMKNEQKPVRYVQINLGKYKTLMNKEGTVLKPMPPY
ncbi:hypothetical protein [Ferroplasma sp.]|uniref:hypothetical protein n=1 Tax=Ferroplasma sp. TaxID=2591003 RepID=UPI00263A35C4|nr:hypothetical protein [Ferroplasma sp.]MCL4453568.1 hypothetical protein [Candidatus Thermoplasmatota archaeon]WMT50930.1 MAG: hypothetical protein RE471_08105 [Ferroplasma sp.]